MMITPTTAPVSEQQPEAPVVAVPDFNAEEEQYGTLYTEPVTQQEEEYVPSAGVADGGGDAFQEEYLPPQTDNVDYQPGYDAPYEEEKVEVPVEITEAPALEVQIPSSATVPDAEPESPS